MTKRRISSGSSFEAIAGCSRALVDGDFKIEIEVTARQGD